MHQKRRSERDLGINVRLVFQQIFKETGFEDADWIHLAQDKYQWWPLVRMVMKCLVL